MIRAKLERLQSRITTVAAPVLLLLVRLVFGYGLIAAGWGKLTHLDQTSAFFGGLGIPIPGVTAAVVGTIELCGGALLCLGLATRAAAFALTVILVVAMLTAHHAQLVVAFSDPGTLIGAAPFPYLAVAVMLFAVGAGQLSLDHALSRR
ncbi:MAG TPA: DoxX family protein [Kofleriaceae bacterium]|nr:DoxX family protein [Kofleriaceae bacterium]